jgi:hypothetical protein
VYIKTVKKEKVMIGKQLQICVLCLLFFITCFFLTPNVCAYDGIFAGFGAEANAYSHEGAAAGGKLLFGIDLNGYLTAGLKTGFSHNFDTVGVLEPLAFFRYYLPMLKGPFVEAQAGMAFFFEDGKTYPAFSGGLAAGWRFAFGKDWYLEPSLRGGYPFAWSAGLSIAKQWRKL